MCFEGVRPTSDANICEPLALKISRASLSAYIEKAMGKMVELTVVLSLTAVAAAAIVSQLKAPSCAAIEL